MEFIVSRVADFIGISAFYDAPGEISVRPGALVPLKNATNTLHGYHGFWDCCTGCLPSCFDHQDTQCWTCGPPSPRK